MIRPVNIVDGLIVEMDLLTHRLTKSIQASCKHPNEHVYCPDCKKVRSDERPGSAVRAESEMQREDLP